MCGRYVITKPVTKTKKYIKSSIKVNDDDNYNAHPYQILPVIKSYTNGNTLENLKWGMVPSWAKQKDFKALINARLETINEKISFKKLIKVQRCVAIMDGFYEWKREEKTKTPFYFHKEDKDMLFVASIFDKNEFCLITENADENLKEIHHRQPVILNSKDINNYLNLEIEGRQFLDSRKRPKLQFYQVSKEVNKPTNNNLSLIQKINET